MKAHGNYYFVGNSVKVNRLRVKGRTKLEVAHIAIFAAQGVNKIKCFCQPKSNFATTGNELQSVDDYPIEFEPKTTMPSVYGSQKLCLGKATGLNENPSRYDSRTAAVNLGTRCKASVAVNFVPTTIYNSNLHLIALKLTELGFESNIIGNLPDGADECAKGILMHQNETDLLITTGGVSKKIDIRLFWRMDTKHGAPVIG